MLWFLAIDVVVPADPPDADVYQGDVRIGHAGEVLHVTVADPNAPVTFRLERAGCEPVSFQVVFGDAKGPLTLEKRMLPRRTSVPWLWLLAGLTGVGAWVWRRPSRKAEMLGGYELVERLGEGGSATVYRAVKARGSVVIKVLSEKVGADTRQRFIREAQEGQALEHPGIVRVLEWHDDAPSPWIVFEHVAGHPLRDDIQPEGMPLPRVLEIARQLGDTLQWLHEQGVVHRDLKPDNVLVGDDGKVRLLDLGVARWTERTTMTATADAPGSLAYTAPEVFSGDRGTPLSDQYSLAVMLYEMLAGTRPFDEDAENRLVVIKRHLLSPVAPISDVPSGVNEALARMLAKKPEARYPTLQEALQALADGGHHDGE